jgi:hypothetical protein
MAARSLSAAAPTANTILRYLKSETAVVEVKE